MSRTAWY